jgi:hypothetical protein
MNSIAQLAARSGRLSGAPALRQAKPFARRAFTNGMLTASFHILSRATANQSLLQQVHQHQSLDSSPLPATPASS